MARTIGMPKFGLTMETGQVSRWLKGEGDWVSRGEGLVEISTDKIVNEYESPYEGYLLRILLPEGQEVKVTEPICLLGEKGEEVTGAPAGSPLPDASAAPAASTRHAPQTPAPSRKGRVSPLAKRLAEKHGVDLSAVTGSGPGGRIVKEDVLTFLRSGRPSASSTITAPAAPEGPEPVRLSERRRIIAERLSASKREIPHFYLKMHVDMTRALGVKEDLAVEQERSGVKVTVTHLIVKATAMALGEIADVNVSFTERGIVRHGSVDVGVAVDLPDGLLVPVVRAAHRKSLVEVAAAVNDLVRRARENALDVGEITGGTFTITNMGVYGVAEFAAIINPPEAAILAVGAIEDVAVVDRERIVARPTMTLTLSVDHRAIDGGVAARFLKRIRELLEHPACMLLKC